jgi:flavin-dependent dehydrogenase
LDSLQILGSTDVIVIGAGPAGCATAIWCAQQRLRVTILEELSFPRHRPGETLHPGINSLFKQLGIDKSIEDANFLRFTGQWVTWSGETHFQNFGQDEKGVWHGYQAIRSHLDSILLERARELGVTVLLRCKPIKPLFEKERIVGIQTANGNIKGKYVVDATGGLHWLGNYLGSELYRASPRLTAYYAYYQGSCPARDAVPALVGNSNGWTWTAKITENIYNWTHLSFQPLDIKKIRHYPDEFQDLKSYGSIRGSDVTWRLVTNACGAGYFMVGDAAFVLDPLSSRGVVKAILSGIRVGNLIVRILNKHLTEAAAFIDYQTWLNHWFDQDVDQMKQFYLSLNNSLDWHRT